jgi:hypothetical protein
MSCPCNNPQNLPELPTPSTLPPPQTEVCVDSAPSEGAEVPLWVTDAGGCDQDLTLLGRFENRMARFVGNGFIQVIRGKARLVQSIPLQVRYLWHEWVRLKTGAKPVYGNPLPYPFRAVLDAEGNCHAAGGLTDSDSVAVWDHAKREFSEKPVGTFPQCVANHIPQAEELELTGYVPLETSDSPTLNRCLKAFTGSGVIVVEQRPAPINGCGDPVNVSVAKLLPLPSGSGEFVLAYNADDGVHWKASE